MKQFLYRFAAWGLLMGLTGPAQAQYMYTTLDVPGSTGTGASGINTSGQVVGWYNDAGGIEHGFLLDVDGNYTTLDAPGAIQTEARGINDAGQVVGLYRD